MDYDYFESMTGLDMSEDEFDDLLETCEQMNPDLFTTFCPNSIETAEAL